MGLGDTMGQQAQEGQNTQDEIGPDQETYPVFKILRDPINIRQLSTIIQTRNTAPDTIWGREDWAEEDWDGSYDNSLVVVRVVNPDNQFIERFRTDNFEDTGSTTADWDTTNKYIDFTAGQVAQTSSIFLNSETILTAKPNITIDSGSINIYLSRDAGVSWGVFTNNTTGDFSNLNYMLEDFTAVGNWQNSFDGTDAESIATISDRTGLKTITQLYGDPSTVLNDCEDHTVGWTNTTDCVVSTNSTDYKHGSNSVNMTKSAGTGSNCGADITFASQSFGDTTKKITFWMYIDDQATLDKISSLSFYVTDSKGTGWNVWRDSDASAQITLPSIGWNYYRVTVTSPTTEEGGGADETDIVKMRIRIFTNNNSDTWTAGKVIIDQIRRYNQSGYGSAINASYAGDWTGHSTADTVGFYFYCPDSTKFDSCKFAFGDIVSGGTQANQNYTWSVSNGDITNGWNYLSAQISDFSTEGSYTLDFSDIAQLRFTTTYAGSTTDSSPYEDDDTEDYYFSDLIFESQSGTPTVTNDLRLKLAEDNTSTARVSEIKIEYTT